MDCDRLGSWLGSAALLGLARISAGAAPRLAGALGTGRVARHQVLVPDGMGGYHIDHLLLTPAAYCAGYRRVAGLISGDQMSDWTSWAGGRYTCDNPQRPLYDESRR